MARVVPTMARTSNTAAMYLMIASWPYKSSLKEAVLLVGEGYSQCSRCSLDGIMGLRPPLLGLANHCFQFTGTRAMITGIHHVQITIPTGQEVEARRFYCDFLKIREVCKPESLGGRGGFWLAAGDRQVHIGTEDGVERTATKAHVAYSVQGLIQWRRKLADAGIDVFDGVPIPGYERFEFRDPFGNRVEFIEAIGS
jgi:catechol 2,3-dioxygenase-like lactoylglutathione lyase family enzyme